jgi:hypothetical protein
VDRVTLIDYNPLATVDSPNKFFSDDGFPVRRFTAFSRLKAVVDKLKEKENEVQLGEVCRTASVDKEGLLSVTVGSDLEKLFS